MSADNSPAAEASRRLPARMSQELLLLVLLAGEVILFAGIGKNGQIVSISKSEGLVVVRMGNEANTGEVSIILLDQIWQHLNEVMCNSTAISESTINEHSVSVFPNPAHSSITIELPSTSDFKVEISNLLGERVMNEENQTQLDIAGLMNGVYILTVRQGENMFTKKIIKY